MPVPISGPVRADSGQALRLFALAGLGIIMPPWPIVKRDLEEGALCEILQGCASEPLPLHFLALPGRMKTPKVQCFVDIVSKDLSEASR